MQLADFDRTTPTFAGVAREVFVAGAGPAVVVMHEIPGLYPGIVDFAARVIDAGFRVYLPSLVGEPGRPMSNLYAARSLATACVAREFTVWATRKNSPITSWLRALARQAHEESGGRAVGAVGMCLTGGFALAMMVDPWLAAPVLSQPSLPFGVTRAQRRDLGIDDATLVQVKRRVADGACVMGLRFTGDPLVPDARFQRLRDELGDGFLAVELDSSPGNPHGVRRFAHAVLGHDYVDRPGHPTRAACDRVLEFLRQRLA